METETKLCLLRKIYVVFFYFYFQEFMQDIRSWLYEGDGHDQQKWSRLLKGGGPQHTRGPNGSD